MITIAGFALGIVMLIANLPFAFFMFRELWKRFAKNEFGFDVGTMVMLLIVAGPPIAGSILGVLLVRYCGGRLSAADALVGYKIVGALLAAVALFYLGLWILFKMGGGKH